MRACLNIFTVIWQLRNEFDEVLDAIIQEHRDLASGKRAGQKPNDFISVLLDLPGENGEPHLDEKTIKALIIVSYILYSGKLPSRSLCSSTT